MLVLHDTTKLSYRHEENEPIGIVMKTPAGPPRPGRPRFHTNCDILMHSSLVITRAGQPLGLAAFKFWSRDKFHGANALKRKINPTRVPIEKKKSIRWPENLRQPSELLGEPAAVQTVGIRSVTPELPRRERISLDQGQTQGVLVGEEPIGGDSVQVGETVFTGAEHGARLLPQRFHAIADRMKGKPQQIQQHKLLRRCCLPCPNSRGSSTR